MENAEPKPIDKKRLGRIVTVVAITIMALRLLSTFPVIEFNGRLIPMFAPLRPVDRMMLLDVRPWGYFEGRVLGSHVLETEHGEIRLGNFARIAAQDGTVFSIYASNFSGQQPRASHNLVVNGMVMPQSIHIAINHNQQISTLALDSQELIVSDVPLGVGNIELNSPRRTAGIVLNVGSGPEYIFLADSTQIHIDPSRWSWGGLFIYNDDDLWVLRNMHSAVPVRFPGETEFTEYRSITFRPDWGEFIEGVLVE